MRGMDAGPWTSLGSLGWFLGVWVVMMAAMMFPSVAPTVALYSRMTKERSPLSPWLFAGGYLLIWAAAGLVAYLVGVACDVAVSATTLAWDNAGRALAAATLFVAAAYELTPLKDVCLAKCRSPLGVAPRLVARRPRRRPADGRPQRRLVRRLLLGADGLAVRTGRDEHLLDGDRRRHHRGREDGALAPRRSPTPPPPCCSPSASSSSLAPDSLPGLTVPSDTTMHMG